MSSARRLPFIAAATIIVGITFGPLFGIVWVGNTFNWPNGLTDASGKALMWLGFLYAMEVASRIGPKSFPTSLSEFSTHSRSDRVVFGIASVVFLIVILSPVYIEADLPYACGFLFLGFAIPSFIIFIFGSNDLRGKFFPKALIRWLTEQASQSTQS